MTSPYSFAETWMPMGLMPPEPCETFEVRLGDGSVEQAFWTGKKWWLRGQDVHPREWRLPQKASKAN